MRVLVIGGTQFFGKLIVEQFLARGDQVTIFSRGLRRPEFWDAIEHIRGDRDDNEAFVRTLGQHSTSTARISRGPTSPRWTRRPRSTGLTTSPWKRS